MTYQASVNNLVPGGTVIQNCAVMTYAGSGPVTSCAPTTVTGQFKISIGVYNEAGELVYSLPTQEYSQPFTSLNLSSNAITAVSGPGSESYLYFEGVLIGTWNGQDSTGNPVTNGKYFVKVQSTDPLGAVTTITQPVVVNRSIYKVSIRIYNEAGEVVRNLYTYMGNPGPGSATKVQLSSEVFSPTSGTPVGTGPTDLRIMLNNGTTVVWNGESNSGAVVTSGQYFVEVDAQDGQGGDSVVTAQVMVLSENAHEGMGNITARPNVVNRSSPNGSTVWFVSDSAQSLTLSYKIYTVAGELVKGSTSGLPGTNSAQWDASGKASGLYFALVEAMNSQGGLVGHKSLKIVIDR
jgi:hypothetical protein